MQAHGCRCGGVGHVNLVGVGRRRHGCRVGRGALIVGAGAKLAESKGEEEATGTVPDGAQVSGETRKSVSIRPPSRVG